MLLIKPFPHKNYPPLLYFRDCSHFPCTMKHYFLCEHGLVKKHIFGFTCIYISTSRVLTSIFATLPKFNMHPHALNCHTWSPSLLVIIKLPSSKQWALTLEPSAYCVHHRPTSRNLLYHPPGPQVAQARSHSKQLDIVGPTSNISLIYTYKWQFIVLHLFTSPTILCNNKATLLNIVFYISTWLQVTSIMYVCLLYNINLYFYYFESRRILHCFFIFMQHSHITICICVFLISIVCITHVPIDQHVVTTITYFHCMRCPHHMFYNLVSGNQLAHFNLHYTSHSIGFGLPFSLATKL